MLQFINCKTPCQAKKKIAAISALACCDVSICLENLRFDTVAAITHLKIGAHVIVNSFDLQPLIGSSSSNLSSKRTVGELVCDADLKDVLYTFRHLKIFERLFTFEIPLIVDSHFYDSFRLVGSTIIPDELENIAQLHRAVSCYVDDVMGYD